MEERRIEYIAVKAFRTEFYNPIVLQKGERVIIGEESTETWPNWVFCTKADGSLADDGKEDGSRQGWVPKQIIHFSTQYGEILENYSAQELDIDEGTVVEGIRELNGWLWVRNTSTNEIGWVPMENLKRLD